MNKFLITAFLIILQFPIICQDFKLKYPYQLKEGLYYSFQDFLDNNPTVAYEDLDDESVENLGAYSKLPEYREKAPKNGHRYNINNVNFSFPATQVWGFVYNGTLYVFIDKNKYAVITNLETISSAVLRYYKHHFNGVTFVRNNEFLHSYLVNMRTGELYQIRTKGDFEFLRNRLCRDFDVCVKKLKDKNFYDVLIEVNKKHALMLPNHLPATSSY